MNKTLLKEALKLQDGTPTYSQIEKLCKEANLYQSENETYFIYAKYRKKVEILDVELFFKFVSEVILENTITVTCFEDIENIVNAKTREENIKTSGNSKSNYVRVFDNVVIFQMENSNPILYKNIVDIPQSSQIVAVENGETFLHIDSIMSKFGFNNYVYIGGFSNTLTREFLKDKDVVFYLDYDIEAIRIYDSFECKKKSFFKHPDLEEYFKDDAKNKNIELYLKQRASLPQTHKELQWLIELIKNSSRVVEQEVLR